MTTGDTILEGKAISGLQNPRGSESVADDGSIVITTGVAGFGTAQIGDNEQSMQFTFSADGTVTVISNSALAINSDTDGNFCVYDVGAGIAMKNRLGSTKTIRYNLGHSA